MINLKIELKINHKIFVITLMTNMTENNKAFPRAIKNCPRFDTGDAKWSKECNFDFTEEFYKTFQDFMFQNPGKTTKELVQMITFYSFTEDSLKTAFMMFNTWKNTFHGVCGPFIFKNDRWFPVYAKKYQDTVKLAQENSELRKKIEELEKKLLGQ
tara:strand:- start:43 stop:510 length:468 start_codon:yes stop_codon:yes gene_type:complete